MNNIYYDYIGAKGSYEINDYVDSEIIITSNILNNKIDLTSNILETHSSNYTNNLRTDINKLINEENETTLKHTYIYNSNLSGEIRFWVKSTPFFPPQIPANDPPYRVKIDPDGKLKLYYTYDQAINSTWLSGWVDVINIVIGLVASDVNSGLALGALQIEIGGLNQKIDLEIEGVYSALVAMEAGDLEANVEDLNFYRETLRNSLTSTSATQNLNFAYGNLRTLIQTRNSSYLSRIQTSLTSAILQNPLIAFITGTGGVVLGIIYGIAQNISFNNYLNSLQKDIDKNSNLTTPEKQTLRNLITDDLMVQNDIETATLEYQKNIFQGFINSNITTPQLIPKITTTEITYNGVEISTTLNNYVLKAGGTMTGRLNFNYGANFGTPVGGGGGSGERINLNTNGITISDYPPSLGVSGNSLWFSSPVNHSYQWFNNGNQLMSLTSSGQLILNNPITTAERQYPPKAYTSSTNESVITFLGQSGMLSSTITLNPIGITYGSGVYELYSSSRYNPSEYQKRDLFNYATTTNEVGGHWASGQYTQFGVYQGISYIKPDYLGDFLVVKLPNPIILTKFRFYPRLGLNFRIPGEFKFYGSMNNIDYTEITQASQITPRLTTNDIINGYYEKTLAAGFNTPYLYIGFAVNKLIGTSGFPDCVNFQEFQIYGKEVLSSTASLAIGTSDASTYALNVNGVLNASSILQNNETIPTITQTTILNNTPNVSKKYMLTGTCTTSILMPDNITYFKYDIDLRNYTGLKYAPNPNTPYRIFKIKVFFGSVYFEYLTNNKPNVLSYEIYMSNESQGGGGGIGSAGVNICAIGYPENVILNAISPTQLSLVRTGDFNFISILSRVNGTVFNSIIEDCLF